MGFFSKSYEPGGEYHIRITDKIFDEALKILETKDADLMEHYNNIAIENDCAKYNAPDFPVTEMIGAFLLSYELQEDENNVPKYLRIGDIQLGRKDQVEYEKFAASVSSTLKRRIETR